MDKAEFINEIMRKKEITVEELAKELKINPSTWYRWLKKPEKITIGAAEKICIILELSSEQANFIFAF